MLFFSLCSETVCIMGIIPDVGSCRAACLLFDSSRLRQLCEMAERDIICCTRAHINIQSHTHTHTFIASLYKHIHTHSHTLWGEGGQLQGQCGSVPRCVCVCRGSRNIVELHCFGTTNNTWRYVIFKKSNLSYKSEIYSTPACIVGLCIAWDDIFKGLVWYFRKYAYSLPRVDMIDATHVC